MIWQSNKFDSLSYQLSCHPLKESYWKFHKIFLPKHQKGKVLPSKSYFEGQQQPRNLSNKSAQINVQNPVRNILIGNKALWKISLIRPSFFLPLKDQGEEESRHSTICNTIVLFFTQITHKWFQMKV